MYPPVSPITGLIRLGADLAFLAIAGHADRVLDAQRHEVLRGLLGTFFTQHQVVFPAPAFVAEAFPASIRYSGSSLGYQLASITAGGPAPLIATVLLQHYHTSTSIAVYIALCSVLSLICTFLMPKVQER